MGAIGAERFRRVPIRRRFAMWGLATASLSLAVFGAMLPRVGVAVEPLAGVDAETLAREPLLTPDLLGDGSIDGLQFADPTEGLVLVSPPVPGATGHAEIAYPLIVPPGRGITPAVNLKYNSGGGNGWLGLGWDLDMGSIEVDTRWGAPHFDPDLESESYLIDGEPLVPNALGDSWEPRVQGDRQDYTRRVETDYDQIIRRSVGDGGPDDYFWEVHDKQGNVRWYGGHPDNGGPDGEPVLDAGGVPLTIDRSAIVYDERDNAVEWLLSAERDVGVNMIRYHYETITYKHTSDGWTTGACTPSLIEMCARHTYLRRIDYTAASERSGEPEDPAYQIHFLLESDLDPMGPWRTDSIVNATGGYVDLTIERLERVEVRYGPPAADAARVYDQTAARYDITYAEGPFGKSLLSSVTQVADPASESAVHSFEYVNTVSDSTGAYTGFQSRERWNTGEDLFFELPLDTSASVGALGASTTVSGEGRLYVGFNPASPTKTGSAGGSAKVTVGTTSALSEWIDINGDSLPDKVFLTLGGVKYRANRGGANGQTTFGPVEDVRGLTLLSSRSNFTLQTAIEAHLGVTAAFGVGGDVSVGALYFTDVNADGLPDFVAGPVVFFNHLDDGVPTFSTNSRSTPVPLPSTTRSQVSLPDLDDFESDLAEQSPLVDTIRRWQAPLSGTVTIDAPVTLSPVGPLNSVNDGVRVAIQHNDAEFRTATLTQAGDSAFGDAIDRAVARGDVLYFRVGSIDDGANDEVVWSPTISYTAIDGVSDIASVPLDVNGLSQTLYSASDDFTLSGRPGAFVEMPNEGTVRLQATVTKTRATTDELRLVLTHNGTEVPGSDVTIAADFVGDFPIEVDFSVAAPIFPTSDDPDIAPFADSVHTHLAVDNPIDLTAVSWAPRLIYIAAVDADGHPLDVGTPEDPRLVADLPPEVEQYPQRSADGISTPWAAPTDGTYDARVTLTQLAPSPGGEAIVSIRTRNGVVAKGSIDLPPVPEPPLPLPPPPPTIQTFAVDLDAELAEDVEYWFDVTIRDPDLSDAAGLVSYRLRPEGPVAGSSDIDVPGTLHWVGRAGVFPLSYRGWAVAGYMANGPLATSPIDPSAFEIDPADLPDPDEPIEPPTGFGDSSHEAPAPPRSVAYSPVVNPPAIPAQSPALAPAWRGTRDNLAASAERVRSSRLNSDTATVAGDGGTGRGVTRISLTAPSASLSFGLGPLGGSIGASPGTGLLDYEDLNGDGFPDVVAPGLVQFTTQRGKFLPLSPTGDLVPPNGELTISAQFGISSDLVDIKGNSKGKTNATKGSAAGKGDDANDSHSGVVDAGIGVNASWTSPNLSAIPSHPLLGGAGSVLAERWDDLLAQIPGESVGLGLPIQQTLVDINGDGLPDRVFTTATGVFARYNLGYSFTPAAVKLTTGGFESRESYGGSLSAGLGFKTPDGSYSGGFAINTNLDLSRYSWRDVNGDGILDQVFNPGPIWRPLVAFGTGSGVLAPVEYGEMERATIVSGIELNEQTSLDSSIGVGGSFDVTIPIGPLCVIACYLIVNPGASAQVSFSSPEVDLQDVDGDGYPDSVSTTNDDTLWVRRNTHGATNLLARVANPLGGSFSLEYERYGNTYAHPGSVWALSLVEVDDGRPGNGADVVATQYEYQGLRYDRLHRESLGFASITEHELDTTSIPRSTLRRGTREFLNGNVFVAGLEKSLLVIDPATGDSLQGSEWTWAFRDVRDVPAGFDVHAPVEPVHFSSLSELTTPQSLTMSVAPLLVQVEETWFAPGNVIGQQTRMDMTYDGLGNIVVQVDHGETEDPNDDLVATIGYSTCDVSSSPELGCVDQQPPHVSPLWSDLLCPTWVSLPAEFTITNGKSGAAERVYRHRDGGRHLCDNASVTLLREDLGNGEVAVTQLNYDEWGSYDRIVYPAGLDGRRYAVQYEYDRDRHSDIAIVREFDLDDASTVEFLDLVAGSPVTSFVQKGLVSSATFDPLAGRVATRTDANGNVTTYEYDSLARIKTISSPRAADPQPLVIFGYAPTAAGYAYAVAHHYDAFNPDDTIDTVTFVDGIGRTTQTKRDASLFVAPGAQATVGRIVSGATNFDALGRAVEQFNPTVDTKAQTVFESLVPPGPVTTTEYDLYDNPVTIVEPGDRVSTLAYEYGRPDPSGPRLYRTTVTDPRLRRTITFTDVHDLVRAIDDQPAGHAALRTTYDYDGLGQLLRVVDIAGNETTHAYDTLGRRVATTTPDGGLVEFGFDDEGKLTTKVTPNLRAAGNQITYTYELGRLVGIDYPDGTPDVSYTYGATGAPHNGAGRVVRSEDGSRIVERQFDPLGAVVRETVEMKLHAWHNPGTDPALFRWTTEWSYDGFGRLKTMVYPDGERLTYDYDAGGLIRRIVGEEEGFRLVATGAGPRGNQAQTEVPHTWTYEYLRDQQYDEFLRRRYQEVGNGTVTEYDYDPDTQWLTRQRTLSPNRRVKNPAHAEIQDLKYTYDSVGNPLTYSNDLPKPVPNLFGGATTQTYTYDAYDRIVSASGQWEQAPGKLRRYSFAIEYDENGNVISKDQKDQIFTGQKPVEQKKRSYSFDREYSETSPHQATSEGPNQFQYDAAGNLTGITDGRGKFIRRIEWDATGRMRSVTDRASTTTYEYDDTGQRTIERGPAGETAFVNPWVTVRNRTEMFKHIWAGDDRLATKRDREGGEELHRYFLHRDLQGSTNVMTDYRGDVFQHHEYFPTGEVWVDESSTVFRTPYQYGGGYVDETRRIINFGDRWYDQNREMFYSPDAVLVNDPLAVIHEPELRSAYSYAGSNPLTFIDPTGLQRRRAQPLRLSPAEITLGRQFFKEHPKQAAEVAKTIRTRLPRLLVRFAFDIERADRLQKFADRFDAKPLFEIDLTKGTVKFSFGIGKQFLIFQSKVPDANGPDSDSSAGDATGVRGRVNLGGPIGPPDGGQGPEPPRTNETGPNRSSTGSADVQRPPNTASSPPIASGDEGGARSDQ